MVERMAADAKNQISKNVLPEVLKGNVSSILKMKGMAQNKDIKSIFASLTVTNIAGFVVRNKALYPENYLDLILIGLQHESEFQELTRVLIRYKRQERLLEVIKREEYQVKHRVQAIVDACIISFEQQEYLTALRLWHDYSIVLLQNKTKIIEALVRSFETTQFSNEVRYFFLTKFFQHMTYGDVDRIVSALEKIFGDVEPDGSNQVLLVNLNPIKTACHLLMFFDKVGNRYSSIELRASGLYEELMNQLHEVLVNLFFPKDISMQVRQIDMLENDALFYLERLDAFPIL